MKDKLGVVKQLNKDMSGKALADDECVVGTSTVSEIIRGTNRKKNSFIKTFEADTKRDTTGRFAWFVENRSIVQTFLDPL